MPGLVGRYEQWKNIVAKAVDAGMDQKATIGVIAEKKVRSFSVDECHISLMRCRITEDYG